MTEPRDIFESGFGWITPTGKIVTCNIHAHLDDFTIQQFDMPDFMQWFESERESVESIREGCEQLSERGEHPEWHSYEIANDSFHYQALTKLYELNFIRIGKNYDEIELEGFKYAFEKNADIIQSIKDLAPEFNCQVQILIRRK